MPVARLLSPLVALLLFTIASPAWSGGTVLFDQAHGERFLLTDQAPLGLSGLAEALKSQQIEVKPLKDAISEKSLAGSTGIIISGPFAPFTPAEIDALMHYIEQGGAVAVMLHIAPPAAPLLQRLGVASANGVIRERERLVDNEPLNFGVATDGGHPLLQGVSTFNLYGAWALLPVAPHARAIAATTDKAWIDRDGDRKLTDRDAVQSFAVAVTGTIGKGKFVVFGDDAIFQNKFLTAGNLALAINLAHWLAP
jgi:hypothetical protein